MGTENYLCWRTYRLLALWAHTVSRSSVAKQTKQKLHKWKALRLAMSHVYSTLISTLHDKDPSYLSHHLLLFKVHIRRKWVSGEEDSGLEHKHSKTVSRHLNQWLGWWLKVLSFILWYLTNSDSAFLWGVMWFLMHEHISEWTVQGG